jgi:hypothetical protein
LFLLKELALSIESGVVFSGFMMFEASLEGGVTLLIFSGFMMFEASLEGGVTLLMFSVQS